jgi:hypothetical protein
VDTGISELAFTSASMGMAAAGCRAVADTMTVDFMLEAFSTLVEQAGKLRYMSGGATSVPMVMRAPAGNTKNMGPHHAGAYWPLFAHCPGLLVAVPAFAADAKVRKTPSWPRSWANFSLLSLYSHRNAWANLHLLGQRDTLLAEGADEDRAALDGGPGYLLSAPARGG